MARDHAAASALLGTLAGSVVGAVLTLETPLPGRETVLASVAVAVLVYAWAVVWRPPPC